MTKKKRKEWPKLSDAPHYLLKEFLRETFYPVAIPSKKRKKIEVELGAKGEFEKIDKLREFAQGQSLSVDHGIGKLILFGAFTGPMLFALLWNKWKHPDPEPADSKKDETQKSGQPDKGDDTQSDEGGSDDQQPPSQPTPVGPPSVAPAPGGA